MAVDDGLANHIAIGVRGLVGALYLTDLASKTRRGLAGNWRRAKGRADFLMATGRSQGARGVVLRIFRAYAEGYSPRDISASLNVDRIAPARGRAWNASTIHGSAKRASGMIANEVYRGVIVWNR